MRSAALPQLLASLALALAAPLALGQAWPTKPVRIVVPYPAGGVVDVQTRAVTIRMAEELGQAFVVEAKPGASGSIGAEAVANAAPDGYTLLVSAPFLITSPMMQNNLRWKPSDFVPVARFSQSPSYFLVPANSPANSVKDYAAMAKAAGNLQYGDGGIGTTQSMAVEMFSLVAGIKLEAVMYKGAPPSIPDLITGLTSMSIVPSSVAVPQVKAGKLKALANTSDKRSAQLPDVPTIAEAGYPDVTVLSWYGLHAPAATPPDIVRKISDAVKSATAHPDVKARMTAGGGELAFMADTEFKEFLTQDAARWDKFVNRLKK